MFDFGRDLRKLFDSARHGADAGDDLGWLELVPATMVESEARRQSTDAGRVSCTRPFEAWMAASALWREHARRSGAMVGLERAASASSDAQRAARNEDQRISAALEAGEIHLLRFDLYGGPEGLAAALADARGLAPERRMLKARTLGLIARLETRQAMAAGDDAALENALTDLDAALDMAFAADVDRLKLERAGVLLQVGVLKRDSAMLDRAGRDLSALIEASAADERPLSRARAVMLAAAGLRALATLAGDISALAKAEALTDAAADLFTPDHAPLDWAAVQLARQAPLAVLQQAEAAVRQPGLIVAALVTDRRLAVEIDLATAAGDQTSLRRIRMGLLARLSAEPRPGPVDWAVLQIGLARLDDRHGAGRGLILAEAELTAREAGAPALADRARALV